MLEGSRTLNALSGKKKAVCLSNNNCTYECFSDQRTKISQNPLNYHQHQTSNRPRLNAPNISSPGFSPVLLLEITEGHTLTRQVAGLYPS
jgi:hypothetical protein